MRDYVDERLFAVAPFYREMFLRNHPEVQPESITEEMMKGIVVEALLASGDAKAVVLPDRSVRIEASPKFLKALELKRPASHQLSWRRPDKRARRPASLKERLRNSSSLH